MATIVAFHAHPDDESISMGGTIARAVDAGHRVVLVFATLGEHGEVADGVLGDGETLGDRRREEVDASAGILGAQRVVALGYRDSGMMGESTNDDPMCFWKADVDLAAAALVDVLREETADILTVYDAHGGYGHPDHIQVHRVGVRAARAAGVAEVFETTMNRDHMGRMMAQIATIDPDFDGPDVGDDAEFGVPEADITTTVDVSGWLDRKRESMAAHASQIGEGSFFLAMPEGVFAEVFGKEWFIRRDGATEATSDWLVADDAPVR